MASLIFAIISFIGFAVMIFVVLKCYKERDFETGQFAIICCFVLFFSFMLFSIRVSVIKAYRKGQLDAHNNNYKYEFVTKEDSTRVWIEKKVWKNE